MRREHFNEHADPRTAAEAKATPLRCTAYGCRLRGSTSVEGGGFQCTAHARTHPDLWQAVTQLLNEHDWLVAFIDDVRRLVNSPNTKADWRAFARKFWTGIDDRCAPVKDEDGGAYELRMRLELLWRCKVTAQAPKPKVAGKVLEAA